MVFGDTRLEDETNRKVCALFCFLIMKKKILFIILCAFCMNAIHAEITWTLSDDGTLTISGTDIPDYYKYNASPWCYNREIKKVVIVDGVTSIGNYAFYACDGLTSVTIPNSVTSIGNEAFRGCGGLTSITIPNSVTSIGNEAFRGCNGLTSIIVEGGNTYYDSRDNCNAMIETKSNTLIVGCKNTIIPNSVTSIGNSAFMYCDGLTDITIPNSVTSIGNTAFYSCSGLTSVTIPNSVKSIGNSAFCDCKSLTSVTISNSVTSIDEYAFSWCMKLKEIFMLNPTPPSINEKNTFEYANTQHIKVFVPEGAVDAYKYATGWKDFANIYEMAFSSVLPEAKPINISDGAPIVAKGFYKEKTMTYVREGNAISKDNYASFCLPFAVDPVDAQFKAVYVPLGIALYNTKQNTLRLGFYKTDDIIPAGTPFFALLAVDDKVEIMNALPVNYDPNTASAKNNVVRTFNYSDVSGIMSENNDYAINFSGTYKQISPANAYTFNTDGSVGASSSVVPFRAYVVLAKNNTNAKIIASFEEDAETTGITDIKKLSPFTQMYDLNGRMVNENTLQSGIYIKNGKKFVK